MGYGDSRGDVSHTVAGRHPVPGWREVHRAGRHLRRRRAGAGGAAVLVVASLAALAGCSADNGPERATTAFARAWSSGTVAGLTFIDAVGRTLGGAEVARQLKEVSGDLADRNPKVTVVRGQKVSGADATVPVRVNWPVANGVTWSYDNKIALHRVKAGWRVVWAASDVHPDLHQGERLDVTRDTPDRAPILDGSGQPIVSSRPVVTIQAHPKDIVDRAALVKALSDALHSVGVDLSTAELSSTIGGATPDSYVELVTLRLEVYNQIRSMIHELPGLSFRTGKLPLAPTSGWGRAVLGRVAEVQKDRMDANPGVYAVGDLVGYGGIQERFDQRLRGSPGVSVSVGTLAASGSDGAGNYTQNSSAGTGKDRELFRTDPRPGSPVKTTLDPRVQQAADAAVNGGKLTSALVAIRISDGAVIADANGPDGAAVDLSLSASVPPGSTFKMVTAYTLLANGSITADTVVDCPKTYTVDGTTFHNAHNFVLGSVPLHTDFAKSCNTAFASLAPKLGGDGLAKGAADLGIGGKWTVGLDTFTGKVGTNDPPAQQAAAAFGQGTTQVSPIAMAAAAAAIAQGQWRQPILVADPAPAATPPGPQLKPEVLAALKSMMREVVTGGTATMLRLVPGEPVYGKTGTAEYDGNPDHSHSWFVGFQGDIAFAAFVKDGGEAAEATPLVGRFLTALR